MSDWPIDEKCGCPILSHTIECSRKMLQENPRKWGEGLRGEIEILTKERDKLRDALETVNRHCLCTRNMNGFDYGETHKRLGKPGIGKRWLTPRDIAMDALKLETKDE